MKKKIISIFIFIFFHFISFHKLESSNQEKGNPNNGEKIFKQNCTACHSIELKKKMIGPALYDITKKRDKNWLHKWIKDNKSLRKKGDKIALKIYKEYGNIEMNSFPNLSEKDIDDILSFIENPPLNENKNTIKEENKEKEKEKNNDFIIKLFILFLSIISIIILWILYRIFILYRIITNKKKIIINFKNIDFIINFLYKKFLNNKKKWYFFSSFLSVILTINIYVIWNFLMNIDVNKGYQPEQPIYFSHKIHSKINKIDCQYCHSNAKYGKISGIPSMNVCMNCHNTINEYKGNYIENGKNREEYNKEIQKIYNYTGWNMENRKFENKIYPVKWIRIHNMPDFVYFDHSQHIISGGNEIKKFKKVDTICNACHGDVKEMDQIKMAENFTMEWCLSCHRNIGVDSNNFYYKKYFKNNKNHNTLNKIGGTECAKCHY